MLANSKGVPTAGIAPVPDGHRLVHEFLSPENKSGDYTEVFVQVTKKNGYPAASYVLRSNDGKTASEEKFIAVLSDIKGCVNKEHGKITINRSDNSSTSYNWSQLIPQRWNLSGKEVESRRFYKSTDRIPNIIATEICVATDRSFAQQLQLAWSSAVQSQIGAEQEKQEQNQAKQGTENRGWYWVSSKWVANYEAQSCVRASSRVAGISYSARTRKISCRCVVAEIDHPAYRGVLGTTCKLRWQGNLESDGMRTYDGRVEYDRTRENGEYMENNQESSVAESKQQETEACVAKGMKYPCD